MLLSVGICLVLRQEGEVGGYRSQEQLTERKQERFVFSTKSLPPPPAAQQWGSTRMHPKLSEVLLHPIDSSAELEP